MEIVNARIDSTMLGVEDHGIMSVMIGLDYGGSHQGFGGYSLDTPLKNSQGDHQSRRGTAYGCEFVRRVIEVVGVRSWEDLKGKIVRVKREEGWNGSIVAIGNVIVDDWFDPKELAARMKL